MSYPSLLLRRRLTPFCAIRCILGDGQTYVRIITSIAKSLHEIGNPLRGMASHSSGFRAVWRSDERNAAWKAFRISSGVGPTKRFVPQEIVTGRSVLGRTVRHGPQKRRLLLHTAGVDREREILKLLADGVALKEIAARLDLSVKTVDAHKTNLMRKLDLHASSELIKYAIQRKLIRLSSVDVKGGRSSPARLPDRHRPSSHS